MHNVSRGWARTLHRLSMTRVIVEGGEKIYKDGPVIIMSNHQSLFDIIIFYDFLHIQFRWMAKASLFKVPCLGRGLAAAGNIPVEREDKQKARSSLFFAAERIRNGTSVVIFPEGTRGHKDGTMLPFKKGGFVLAKKARVAIQPVTLWGANKIVPLDRKKILQHVHPGTVRVIIHDPIFPDEIKKMKSEELSNKIRAIIESPMDRLREIHKLD